MALTFWILLFSYLVNTVTVAGTGFHYSDEAEADRVINLPGQPPVKFKHYSGYVNLSPHQNKALFYWFFEAQESPSHKPLVLWLSGAANIIVLDSPVGVGYSYINTSQDILELGDRITAIDNYAFLIGWFKKFPNFKSHDFYITGESYAGHYVPELANLIYEKNKHTNKHSHINLKGFMVGNAVLDDVADKKGMIDYAWSHTIISDKLYYRLRKQWSSWKDNRTKVPGYCINEKILQAYADINIYSIYSPVCPSQYDRALTPKLVVADPHFLTPHDFWHTLSSTYDPCAEDYVAKYFNNKEVQKALHANITNLPYPFSSCSAVKRRWNDSPKTILLIIQKLLRTGLRIWIYSGDQDGMVPMTSTRYSIKKMKLKVKKELRVWFDKHQVAGWMEVYEGDLTFITIRGAGHQVPMFAPHQSLSVFAHFISFKSLPSSRF